MNYANDETLMKYRSLVKKSSDNSTSRLEAHIVSQNVTHNIKEMLARVLIFYDPSTPKSKHCALCSIKASCKKRIAVKTGNS